MGLCNLLEKVGKKRKFDKQEGTVVYGAGVRRNPSTVKMPGLYRATTKGAKSQR